MASRTTSACSTPSCGNGRTTTITIDRTERSTGKPRTSGSWPRRGPECHRHDEKLHEWTLCRFESTCLVIDESRIVLHEGWIGPPPLHLCQIPERVCMISALRSSQGPLFSFRRTSRTTLPGKSPAIETWRGVPPELLTLTRKRSSVTWATTNGAGCPRSRGPLADGGATRAVGQFANRQRARPTAIRARYLCTCPPMAKRKTTGKHPAPHQSNRRCRQERQSTVPPEKPGDECSSRGLRLKMGLEFIHVEPSWQPRPAQ
jgi:hypothetical protein